MDSVSLKAPAKVNIFLDINGITDNGYHLLNTVVQTINLYDDIVICKSNSKKINIYNKGIDIPINRKNIIYKAASEFFIYTNIPFSGIDIKVNKKIPTKAGLGGGSSNAAATLIGLNKLFNTNLSIHQLQAIGITLGADVPLFFDGGTYLAEGIGEILTPLPNFPEVCFVIVKPNIGFSTAIVYDKFDKTIIHQHYDTKKIIASIVTSNIKEISDNMYNVFEEVVTNQQIVNIKSLLIKHGALNAIMTGSGSAIFGIFDNKNNAKKSARFFKDLYDHVFICKPIQHGVYINN